MLEDNFKKYLITLDNQDFSRNGIKYINLEDFLLDDDF